MKIGIFDSGIGGLSVLHEAIINIKNADFIYYADVLNAPYGEKSKDEIYSFLKNIIDFFLKQQVDAIVIACNTASTVATPEFRAQFNIPIIAMEPAIKKAIELYPNKKTLIAATPITIKSDKLEKLLEKLNVKNTDLIALPKLVRYAENGEFDKNEIKDYIKSNVDIEKYDVLVLGCTHFNYFKQIFKNLNKNLIFVDGNNGTINQILRKINIISNQKTNIKYYFSGQKANNFQLELIKKCLSKLHEVHEV